MSTKGVPDSLNENSGRIKFLNSESEIDNSDNRNNSCIVMGNSDASEESLVSVYREEDGTIINENAVVFSDIKSVEEWLKLRTDSSSSVDFDLSQNEDLCVSLKSFTPTANLYNLENDQIELCSRGISQAVNESSDSSRSKNIRGLELDTGVSKFFANPCISGVGQNILVLPEFPNTILENKSSAEGVLNFEQLTVLSSPIKSISNNNISQVDFNETNSKKVVFSSLQKSHSVGQVFYSGVNKTLPLIRISKDCLIKGKLLDKSELSQLNSKNSNLLVNGTSKLKTTQVLQTITATKPIIQGYQKPNIIKRRKPTPIYNNEPAEEVPEHKKSLMAFPVKPLRKVSKNSLLKINQPKALIKSDCLTEESVFRTFTKNISATHNNTNRPNDVTPIAVVAISTDKTDDSTEIIIKTESGENIYKGKTSDIMKATVSHTVKNIVVKPKTINKGLKIRPKGQGKILVLTLIS